MVRDQEPPPTLVLEDIRDEGVEADGLAVLAQEFDLFHADRPCRMSVDADVRLIHGNGDAIELAKPQLPGLAHTVPADHDHRAERPDERGIALVRPHLVHRVDIARSDGGG